MCWINSNVKHTQSGRNLQGLLAVCVGGDPATSIRRAHTVQMAPIAKPSEV